MKIKQKDETTGEEIEVEVFSPEEVQAKLAEKETLIAQKDATLANLANEKAELEKKVNEVKPDHPNFKALKDDLKAKVDEINALKTTMEAEKKQRQEEAMSAYIKTLAKGDAEVEKKIKLHLSSTLSGMPETNDAEKKAKLEAAFKLSTDIPGGSPSILDSVMFDGAGAGADIKDNGAGAVQFTAREKALGAKMGISDADYKKYGPKLVNKIK